MILYNFVGMELPALLVKRYFGTIFSCPDWVGYFLDANDPRDYTTILGLSVLVQSGMVRTYWQIFFMQSWIEIPYD